MPPTYSSQSTKVPPFCNFLVWLKHVLSPPAASQPAARAAHANTRRPHSAATAERGRRCLLLIRSLSETPGSKVKPDSGLGVPNSSTAASHSQANLPPQEQIWCKRGERGGDAPVGCCLRVPGGFLAEQIAPPQCGFCSKQNRSGLCAKFDKWFGLGEMKNGFGGKSE